MDAVDSGDRERLADLMNQARAKQRMTWDEVAIRGRISVALLRNIRKGRAPVTLDSEVAIERGLNLPDGWVKRALSGEVVSPNERRDAPDLLDDNERKIWSMDLIDEDLRRDYIRMYRARRRRDEEGRETG